MVDSDSEPLFHDDLRQRFAASLAAPEELRANVAGRVMDKVGSPRYGTSGAANAFIVLVGSEFGTGGSEDRPVYSSAVMGEPGWQDLWRLRIGEPNPHFDRRWARYREATKLWKTLYRWLPKAIGDERMGLSMFAWANLSVTSGDDHLGTPTTHREGMDHHVGPLIAACGARVVVATNNHTRDQIDRWALDLQGRRFGLEDMEAWQVRVAGRSVIAAKAGHPSRGHSTFPVSEEHWVRRVSALLRAAEGDIPHEPRQGASEARPAREDSRETRATAEVAPRKPWTPDDVLEYSLAQWKKLGGTIEQPPKGEWLKLTHRVTGDQRACLVIDLKDGSFERFTNVRISSVARWHEVFGEVAYALDAYFPPNRGVTSTGRSNRVECELRSVANWRPAVARFLELCRDYWSGM